MKSASSNFAVPKVTIAMPGGKFPTGIGLGFEQNIWLAIRRNVTRPLPEIKCSVRPGALGEELDDRRDPAVAFDQENVARLECAAENFRIGREKRRVARCRFGQVMDDFAGDIGFDFIEHQRFLCPRRTVPAGRIPRPITM